MIKNKKLMQKFNERRIRNNKCNDKFNNKN